MLHEITIKPGKWVYEKMEELVRKEAPTHRKSTLTDIPIPVVLYQDILVSLYGAPLEKEDDPMSDFQFREMNFPPSSYKVLEKYRTTRGRMVLIYPNQLVRKRQFIIAVEDINGKIDPVIEVSNGGRGKCRCRQFSKLLNLAYQEDGDLLVMPREQYLHLLERIGNCRVI
jgi:hypothetical protein